MHSWINTDNEGWYRIQFDRYRVPYTYISYHVILNPPNLLERFDVIELRLAVPRQDGSSIDRQLK